MTTQVDALPKYTKKEEVWNSLTHYAGFIFGLAAAIFFIVYGLVKNLSFPIILPFLIYTLFMMMMFFVSGFYHRSRGGGGQRRENRCVSRRTRGFGDSTRVGDVCF